MVDSDWFMIFDNYQNFTEQYNSEGLYWNYWYHVWKTFSVSPFSNNAVFVAGTPAVKKVTVTPSTATVSAGGQLQLNVTVDTETMHHRVLFGVLQKRMLRLVFQVLVCSRLILTLQQELLQLMQLVRLIVLRLAKQLSQLRRLNIAGERDYFPAIVKAVKICRYNLIVLSNYAVVYQ